MTSEFRHHPTLPLLVSNWGMVYLEDGSFLDFIILRGYLYVKIPKHKSRAVHQLVLETFIGPRPQGLLALHIDDNRFNHFIDNLMWGTAKQNAEHRILNGKHRPPHPNFINSNIEGRFKPGHTTNVGRPISQELRDWRSDHLLGREFSLKTLRKMSESAKKRPHPPHSPETIKKMQESAKLVWKNRKENASK